MPFFKPYKIFTGFAVVVAATGCVGAQETLATVEKTVEKRYDVTQITAIELAKANKVRPDSLVVFDVRESQEYAVSRLPGAIRVDPGIPVSQFMRRFVSQIPGKQLVFYCSVGMRSSKLAAALQPLLVQTGAVSIMNLRGGIFRWHEEGLALEYDGGSTAYIHPYNSVWARLVPRGDHTAYEPFMVRQLP